VDEILADIQWSFVDSFLVDGREPAPADQSDVHLQFLSETMREFFRSFKEVKNAFYNGRYEDAIRLLTRAIEKHPTFATVFYHLRAQSYFRLGQYDASMDDWTKKTALAPSSPQAHFNRGQAYERKGMMDLARADYQKAEELEKQEE
jgi:tetratricopeptide (TPR) repeat protein